MIRVGSVVVANDDPDTLYIVIDIVSPRPSESRRGGKWSERRVIARGAHGGELDMPESDWTEVPTKRNVAATAAE